MSRPALQLRVLTSKYNINLAEKAYAHIIRLMFQLARSALKVMVVSLLAKVVEHLVTSETMQMTSTSEQRLGNYIPISPVRDDVAAAYKKGMEWKASKMLLPYKQLCSEKKGNSTTSVTNRDLPSSLAWNQPLFTPERLLRCRVVKTKRREVEEVLVKDGLDESNAS
ncbi:hypothetical protein Syun_003963 [Stephania yunnanensis]|uniref:Uncharacterized protein n=1 Tax=Stephania yunnanensis TaxID=152371 RepID=A0AAP0Q4F4_9MAGN